MSFVIATFYHFVKLSNYYDMKDEINVVCNNVKLKGTILLVEEGINATVSGERNAIYKILDFLRSDARLKGLTWKESSSEYQPFSKMKVRLKREIVNLGVRNLSTSVRDQYVDPEHFVCVSFYFSKLLEYVFITLSILIIGKFKYKNK